METRFINHASLLITLDSGEFILTDPWYLSPAFGGWTQKPSPPAAAIRHLLSLPADKLHVVISHGHDDHLDEFFIRQHLHDAHIYVPKFRTDGLSKRIQRITGKVPVELDENTHEVAGCRLNCFINPDFTLYDAIITIVGDGAALVHANDNWHAYPEELGGKLNQVLGNVPAEHRTFCVQFGIADCFPLNYPEFTQDQLRDHIGQRFEQYLKASMHNLKVLGLESGYYYANQSIYDYPAHWHGPTLYEMAQAFLMAKGSPFSQCLPGQVLGSNAQWLDASPGLFDFCLHRLEAFLASMLKTEHVHLLTSSDQYTSDTVAYQTNVQIWSRILTGELTLEAIIIGGMGQVHKPPGRNISDIHGKVSKLAYFIQSRINAGGLNFYFES